jgi:hypothetical protein
MRYSPRNIEIAFGHAGLTHYGGVLFFDEFIRMLQLRRFKLGICAIPVAILHRIRRLKPLEG